MLNLSALATEQDRKEAMAIERRKAFEEERKKRIFNPRQRMIGFDYETLEKQVEEKRQQQENERQLQKAYEDDMRKREEIALAMEQKEKNERKKIQMEINDFRLNFQRPDQRREFDINDPGKKRKEQPYGQKFEGEDLMGVERNILQKEQIKAWLDQQMQERDATDEDEKRANEAYKAALIARDERALELDRIEKDARKRMEQACIRYNRALAEAKNREKLARTEEEFRDNLAEIYNTMSSDMLTENPDVAQSNMGPGKQIGFLYKGMTREEKDKFREAQLAQIDEIKKRRYEEAQKEKEFNDYTNSMQRQIFLKDQELLKLKKENSRKLGEENLKLANQQRNRKHYLDEYVYKNSASNEFFEQFNKSTR